VWSACAATSAFRAPDDRRRRHAPARTRIRRISAYDLDKSRAEEAEIEKKLKDVAKKLRDLKGTPRSRI
jgi:hypothetical protein